MEYYDKTNNLWKNEQDEKPNLMEQVQNIVGDKTPITIERSIDNEVWIMIDKVLTQEEKTEIEKL